MGRFESVEKIISESGVRENIIKSYTTKKLKSELFFMLFSENLDELFKLKSVNDLKIFLTLCQLSEYDNGKVNFGHECKRIKSLELGISVPTIRNSISSLKKAGLISGSGSEFQLNINVVWKGQSKKRSQVLKDKTKLQDNLGFLSQPAEKREA